MQLGRYSDSASAWRNTLTLLGENAEREANLGEALMAEANGIVTVAAKSAFVRAVALDDKIVSARYYLGRAAEQDGNREEAARIWRGLIAEASPGAHWVNDVRDALARVESNSTAAPAASPGVAVAQSAPAKSSSSPPPQHDSDVQGMVDRLAERVKKSGVDPEGWIMLTRSYLTLGDKEKVAAAIREARAAMASDAAALQNFNEALQRFKINEALNVASATSAPAAPEARAPAQDGNQTNEMIRGMVARLAERLKNDGSDLDGWLQLVRSYVVLGERDKALNAAADARRAVGNDAEKRRRIEGFIRSLGLEG
jgi:cytochrome c-type biogenesis protein CcmH/NrfG